MCLYKQVISYKGHQPVADNNTLDRLHIRTPSLQQETKSSTRVLKCQEENLKLF